MKLHRLKPLSESIGHKPGEGRALRCWMGGRHKMSEKTGHALAPGAPTPRFLVCEKCGQGTRIE